MCVSATVSASVQSFPDERYKIRVQLPGGQSLRGGQELAALLATTSDQNSVYNLPPPLLQRNAIYQLQVTITDPNGMESSYTRSPRLKYEAFNCLTVTPAGMLHVTPLTGQSVLFRTIPSFGSCSQISAVTRLQ